MKVHISAYLLTKITTLSTLLYFEWLMPNGALTQLITTPRFLCSTLNLPPQAAAALTPCPWIGETSYSFCYSSLIMLWLRLFNCPTWPPAYFSPFLHNSSSQIKPFFKGVFELPCIEDLLLEGPGQRQIYKMCPSVFSGCPRFRMLALQVDFRWAFVILVYHARLFSFSSTPKLVIADLSV